MVKRILGIAGITLTISVLHYGACSLFAGSPVGLYYFLLPCFFTLAFFSACALLYFTDKTLWDSVHSAHKKKSGILRMMPDIYVIAEFIDYLCMKTVFKREVIADIFNEFPQLNRIWVKGDLETFYDVTFVIEDCVHEDDFIRFIYNHFDFEEYCAPIVFSESFMKGRKSFNDSYIECKREDYV